MITPAVIIPHRELFKPATISKDPIVHRPYGLDIYWVLKDIIALMKPVLEDQLELENISNNIVIEIVNFNSIDRWYVRYPIGGDNRYMIYLNNHMMIQDDLLLGIIYDIMNYICKAYANIHYHFNVAHPENGCIPSEYDYTDIDPNTTILAISSNLYFNNCRTFTHYADIIYDKYKDKGINYSTTFDFTRWMYILMSPKYAMSIYTSSLLSGALNFVHVDNILFEHHYYQMDCKDTYYDIQYKEGTWYIQFNCNVPPMYRKEDILEYTTELLIYSILDVYKLLSVEPIYVRILEENAMILDSLYMTVYHKIEDIYQRLYQL